MPLCFGGGSCFFSVGCKRVGLAKRADPLNPRDLLKIPKNPWQKEDTPSIPEVLSFREPRAQACEASTDEFCPAEADLSDLRDTQATQAEEARFSGYIHRCEVRSKPFEPILHFRFHV